jgi:hypothetical protein
MVESGGEGLVPICAKAIPPVARAHKERVPVDQDRKSSRVPALYATSLLSAQLEAAKLPGGPSISCLALARRWRATLRIAGFHAGMAESQINGMIF